MNSRETSGENLIDKAKFGSSEGIGEKLDISEIVTFLQENLLFLQNPVFLQKISVFQKNQVYLTEKLSFSEKSSFSGEKPSFFQINSIFL